MESKAFLVAPLAGICRMEHSQINIITIHVWVSLNSVELRGPERSLLFFDWLCVSYRKLLVL